jgi:cytochrome c nitrite reductase small subunit
MCREYAFKAFDGLRHAAMYTLRLEPQVMHLSAGAVPVVQENCIRCHEGRVAEVSANAYPRGEQKCWDCHRDLVHGRVQSLSASPDTSRPTLPSIMEFPPLPPLFGKGEEKYETPNWNDSADAELD